MVVFSELGPLSDGTLGVRSLSTRGHAIIGHVCHVWGGGCVGECVQTCDVVGVDMGVQAVCEFEPEIINYLEVAVNLPQQVSHRTEADNCEYATVVRSRASRRAEH
jgi:hypothetical protein